MAYKTPEQIKAFLDAQMYRMDQPAQLYGDEPNSYRKPWESASVRACLFACWAYEQAAGNLAIPTVYRAINEYREDLLCDRSYFPATPRDLRSFESFGIPIFGIESRHQLADYDVIGTSISYPVLSINFIKQLTMSDIPPLWTERQKNPEQYPMVIVGGQLYGAPEVCANIADVVFCGEVEDEEGNPGIGAVLDRIRLMKKANLWQTKREWCYEELAKEFNFLYFPRFIDVVYGYENRPSIELVAKAWEREEVHPSKQVIGYYSRLDGMRLPIHKRIVKDLNAVEPLDNPPLLYVDPGMGANDVEVQRGCPAWCVAHSEWLFVEGQGLRQVGELASGRHYHIENNNLRFSARAEMRAVSCVVDNGQKPVLRVRTEQGHYIEATADHRVEIQTSKSGKLSRGHREWREIRDLKLGDVLPIYYGQRAFGEYQTLERSGIKMTEGLAWLIGFLVGDGAIHSDRYGDPCAFGFGVWTESEVEAEVRRLCRDELGFETLNSQLIGDGKIKWMRIQNKILIGQLCSDLGFSPGRATEDSKLHVPEVVMQSPESVQQAFVLGLFEADGNVDADAKFVRLVSTSERLCREVGLLLLNLGVSNSWHWKLVPMDRGLVKGGKGFAYHLNVKRALDSDLSWWKFVTPEKEERVAEFRAPYLLAEGASNVNYLQSRRSPIMARVTSVEDAGVKPVADFSVPEGESFDCSGVVVHNCTFCALTYRQKPYRQRSVDYTVDFAQRLLKNTGGLHIAPFGPDFPMHTQKKKLIESLLEKVTDEVDASSMRVDDFIADPSYILLQAHGGMDTVTLGVEGNSQRMRDLVGKGSSDEDIKEAVARGIQAGIKKFKLYMIASLPGEDEEDIYKILQLAKDLADIRDQMSSTARLQFSWTPMLIEGNTPFQWFAPTTANWALGDVWDSFRDLKIDFKLGGKAEKNKLAYFQTTQRASREVGLALVEAALQLNKGTWGGAPAGLYDLIEERLKAHGFLNGLVDVYDERQKKDLFGWEMIDQGINSELLWVTYQQMKEFLENTSASSYDEQFSDDYHGAEWIERCDSRCMGKTCGVCDAKDLQIRRSYIQSAASEIDVDLSKVKVIDQKSLQMKIRCRVEKADAKRFVDNSHFRYAVRRAAALAGLSVTKRHVKFSSDAVKIKNWASGADYLEFGLTKMSKREELEPLMEAMKAELVASGASMLITDWIIRPAQGEGLRADVDLSLYEIEFEKDPDLAAKAIQDWQNADYIPMVFKEETRAGVVREEVNGKDFVADLWLVRRGHRLYLRSLVRGKANPYQVVAALLGQPSWIELAKFPAHRIEAFLEVDRSTVDFFRPSCEDCGDPVPITPLDLPYDQARCPQCLDMHQNIFV